MLKIDHVGIFCTNVMSTAWELHQAGLASYDGGYFPRGGVAHRGVPLGNDQYIEIEQMVDEETTRGAEEGQSQFIFKLRDEAKRDGPKLVAWWVVADDFEAHRDRLGAEEYYVHPRVKPDGSTLKCRVAPRSRDAVVQGLPIFFDFLCPMEQHPARQPVHDEVEPQGVAWFEVGGDPNRMKEWIGPEADSIPLRFAGGAPGIRAMGIAMADGSEIEIRPGGGTLGVRRGKPSAVTS